MEKTLEEIAGYIEKSGISKSIEKRYAFKLNEACALRVYFGENSWESIDLAYNLGRARGYRAAKAEARR